MERKGAILVLSGRLRNIQLLTSSSRDWIGRSRTHPELRFVSSSQPNSLEPQRERGHSEDDKVEYQLNDMLFEELDWTAHGVYVPPEWFPKKAWVEAKSE